MNVMFLRALIRPDVNIPEALPIIDKLYGIVKITLLLL